MNREKIYDILVVILSFIFVISFPWTLFIKNMPFLVISLQIFANILFFIFLIYFIKHRSSLTLKIGRIVWMPFIVLLPSFIVCFSNYFLFFSVDAVFNYEPILWLRLLLTVTVVLNEETIFRGVIQKNLKIENRFKRIVISSGIFAIFHIFNFFSTLNPFDLLTIVYTFGLGLLLAILFEFTNSLIPPLLCHFIFNVFNDDFINMFSFNVDKTTFILINCIVTIGATIYVAIVYILYLRKLNNKRG